MRLPLSPDRHDRRLMVCLVFVFMALVVGWYIGTWMHEAKWNQPEIDAETLWRALSPDERRRLAQLHIDGSEGAGTMEP